MFVSVNMDGHAIKSRLFRLDRPAHEVCKLC